MTLCKLVMLSEPQFPHTQNGEMGVNLCLTKLTRDLYEKGWSVLSLLPGIVKAPRHGQLLSPTSPFWNSALFYRQDPFEENEDVRLAFSTMWALNFGPLRQSADIDTIVKLVPGEYILQTSGFLLKASTNGFVSEHTRGYLDIWHWGLLANVAWALIQCLSLVESQDPWLQHWCWSRLVPWRELGLSHQQPTDSAVGH